MTKSSPRGLSPTSRIEGTGRRFQRAESCLHSLPVLRPPLGPSGHRPRRGKPRLKASALRTHWVSPAFLGSGNQASSCDQPRAQQLRGDGDPHHPEATKPRGGKRLINDRQRRQKKLFMKKVEKLAKKRGVWGAERRAVTIQKEKCDSGLGVRPETGTLDTL